MAGLSVFKNSYLPWSQNHYVFILMMVVHIASILLAFCLQYGAGSAEEWNRFPPLRHVDRFAQCLGDEGGAYCTADIEFIAEGPNELYDAMLNISKSAFYRMNYTKAIYGYCITRRCKKFHTGDSETTLRTALGACLNSTLHREYGLRARIDQAGCFRHGDRPTISWPEWVAGAVFFIVAALMVTGTIYDLFVSNKHPTAPPPSGPKGGSVLMLYLMCFSLRANWAKLTSPWPQDQSTGPLIGLNGIRTITNILIIMMHAAFTVNYSENMDFVEEKHQSLFVQVFVQGAIIMQTFFFLSGLLLAYNMERSNERSPRTRRSLPRAILLRWLRLAPVPYAVLLFSISWLKFCPYGPLWQPMMHPEVEECRRNWPAILSFCQNYMEVQCNIHTWSTAVDFYLHIVGLTIMVLSPTKRVRNSLLWTLLIIGLVLPVVETYTRDLHGTFLIVPELMRERAILRDKTYAYLYRRSHNNIPSFVIGLLLGILLCNVQKNPIDFTKYKKYTILYWLLLPVLVLLSLINAVLLWGRGDMSTRLLIATLRNPTWSVTLALLTIAMIYKVDEVALYRRVLEWPGWVPLARLTYCSYNVHLVIVRWLTSSSLTLFTGSSFHVIIDTSGIIGMSFVIAAALWLLVEAPCTNVVVKLFPEKRTSLRAYSADVADKTN